MTPLTELTMGQGDEAHLYHGWYWRRLGANADALGHARGLAGGGVAAAGGDGAAWRFISRQGAERTTITLHILARPTEVEELAVAIELPGRRGWSRSGRDAVRLAARRYRLIWRPIRRASSVAFFPAR
jgi:hypothetical protein